ncbi:MAG: hypothetical protein GVY15_03275 [Bacteroidetes bacterium]|jgi:hypothetical protein|nr:hypothetical protein [Bacteroidota bacterium]
MNACPSASGSAANGQEDVRAGQVNAEAVMATLRRALTQDEACVLCLGDGPFKRHNMAAFLETIGLAPLDIRSEVRPALLVCGRENLNSGQVDGLMRPLHHAPVLCAQEHVLQAFFSCWDERGRTALITLRGHPVQRWLTPRHAREADTASAERNTRAAAGVFCHGDLLQVLPYVEYAIHGTQARRRKVLRQAYVMDLRALKQLAPAPDAEWAAAAHSPSQSRRSWGARRSAMRLQHVAESLARAQQTQDSLSPSLRTICSKDLSWLRINMYDAGGFDFPWPAA